MIFLPYYSYFIEGNDDIQNPDFVGVTDSFSRNVSDIGFKINQVVPYSLFKGFSDFTTIDSDYEVITESNISMRLQALILQSKLPIDRALGLIAIHSMCNITSFEIMSESVKFRRHASLAIGDAYDNYQVSPNHNSVSGTIVLATITR